METKRLQRMIGVLRLCIAVLVMVILSLFLFSFTAGKISGDFLKQLGLTQSEADKRIMGSLLGGSLDHYGIPNLHTILVGDRAAIVKDIAAHARQYASSDGFKKEYGMMKENNKPSAPQKTDTPEEMWANMIRMAKEYQRTSEEALKSATPDMKKIFEGMVENAKKSVKEAEDPNNRSIKTYAQNYEAIKKMYQQSYDNSLKEWETKYPANHLLYIRQKLQAYLDATTDIDFEAKLYEKNGKKYFVNPVYERKGDRWKMAFRAGKEAVEAGRAFAIQWISEIR